MPKRGSNNVDTAPAAKATRASERTKDHSKATANQRLPQITVPSRSQSPEMEIGSDFSDTETELINQTSDLPVVAVNRETENDTALKLYETTSSIRDGIDLLKSIIGDYREALEDAPPQEKREGLRALVTCDTSVHLARALGNATEAFKTLAIQKQHTESSSNSASAIHTNSNLSDVNTTPFDQTFEIRMIAIPDVTPPDLDTRKLFTEALKNTPMSVQKYEVRGQDGYFRVPTEDHARRALAVLQKSTYKGRPITTLFTVSSTIISQNTIKMVKISNAILRTEITWINGNFDIDIEEARQVLLKSNDILFDKPSDIIYVQTNSLPTDETIITIHVSQNCFNKLLLYGRKSIRLDLGGFATTAYLAIYPATCLRCLAFGHFFPGCTEEPKCKFDGQRHPSGDCPNPSRLSCFRCAEHNRMQPEDQLPTNHNANHHTCTFVKIETEKAWNLRREKALRN